MSVKTISRCLLRCVQSLHTLLAVATVSVLFASCTRHSAVWSRLLEVEALLETDPHAAGAMIDSIPSTSLRGESRARYALLRTQADYKNYVHFTSDSLISIATSYYGSRRCTQSSALAQYYLGCTYKDMGRDLDAVDALLRASTLFPDTTNKYNALCYYELGQLYLNHHMPEKAIPMLEKYAAYGERMSDSLIIGQAYYHRGRAYLRMHEVSKAKDAFGRVIDNPLVSPTLKEECLYNMAKQAFYTEKDPEQAERYMNQYFQIYSGSRPISASYALKGDIEYAASRLDSASQYYRLALAGCQDLAIQCIAYKGLAKIVPLLHQEESVTDYIELYTACLDSLYAQSRQQEIESLNTKHVIELHDRELSARHARLLLWVALTMTVLIATCIISLILIDKKRKDAIAAFQAKRDAARREQIDNAVCEDELLELEETADDVDEPLQAKMPTDASVPAEPMFAYYINEISMCREQYRGSEWAAMMRRCEADTAMGKKLNVETSKEMMGYVVNLFSDLFIQLVNDAPGLSRHDLEFCAMTLLQFQTSEMAYCTQATAHSYYCRRSKLCGKLPDNWYQLIFGKSKKTPGGRTTSGFLP